MFLSCLKFCNLLFTSERCASAPPLVVGIQKYFSNNGGVKAGFLCFNPIIAMELFP